jgi:hypothetical protein
MARDTDLIAAIYDTVIEPSGWDNVVTRIVEATKSASGGILAHQVDALTHQVKAAHITAICNGDPFYMDAYVQHYHKINPLIAASLAIAPGDVRTATLITGTDRFRASPFFQEWVRPQGWADFVGIGSSSHTQNAQTIAPPEIAQCDLGRTGGMASSGNPRAAFAARGGDPGPPLPDESNNRVARHGGRGGRFRRLSLDRGLPGRLRQRQSGGSHPALNRLAV